MARDQNRVLCTAWHIDMAYVSVAGGGKTGNEEMCQWTNGEDLFFFFF